MRSASVLLVLLAAAPAQSLWNPARPLPALTADPVARRAGDVLTVLISERQVVKNKEQTQFTKESSIDASLTNLDAFPNMFGVFPAVAGSSDRDFKADGKYDKEGSLQTRISVIVIDVQPNGNLVIEGRRSVQTDKETKTIRVTGVVRPFDILPNNTVLSENIANASLAYEGTGSLTSTTNRGWLSDLLDYVWPF